MRGQTVVLIGPRQRATAKHLIDCAPDRAVVNIRQAARTTDQNAKMWAMLSDVSRQTDHEGRRHSPEVWKQLFMHACREELNMELQFINGLNGEIFPLGFRSSQLRKSQMAELITFIQSWGDQNGIHWTNEATE